MTNLENVLSNIKLRSYICPPRNTFYPCVICKQCELGKSEEVKLSNGYVDITGNSYMVHLNFTFNDSFDQTLIERLILNLARNLDFIVKEDEYTISFLVTSEFSASKRQKIEKLMINIEEELKSMLVNGKSKINSWYREEISRLSRRIS